MTSIVLLCLVIVMFVLGLLAMIVGIQNDNGGQAAWAFNCVLWVFIAAMWMHRAGAFDSLFN